MLYHYETNRPQRAQMFTEHTYVQEVRLTMGCRIAKFVCLSLPSSPYTKKLVYSKNKSN